MKEETNNMGTSPEKTGSKPKRKLAMPDTYIIVAAIVLAMAALTWVIPPGSYDYHEVEVNGRMKSIAIDGTFHYLDASESNPTGFLAYFKSF